MQKKKLFILISLGLVLISLLAIFNLREKKAKDSERFVGVTNTTKLSIIREEAEPQIKFDTI